MRKNRKTRLRRFVVDQPVREDLPTPQTFRKLRQDIVQRLAACGRLHPRHLEAAEEIRLVQEAVGRGMFPTSQSMMWVGRTSNRARGGDFLDRMSEAERDVWEHRYLPWTHEMATEIAAGIPGTRWLQLVLDVVVDNTTLREVEARYQLRRGNALTYLVGGLDRYVSRRR